MRDERVALEKVSLSIRLGEHVAILGPNGSGKSSLIKTITRELYPLLEPASSLRILGEDTWHVEELRRLLGIVSGDLLHNTTRDVSARDMILSGFFSSIGIWPWHHVTPAMERTAGELMQRLEIAHLAERGLSEMSSGEARRVLIARALVHGPKALILDEPATSLDFQAARELRATLGKLARAGTTIVMVTHHLGDVIPEIGRVVLIRKGRVVGDGPKEEMLTSEALSGLFGTPVEVVRRNGHFHLW